MRGYLSTRESNQAGRQRIISDVVDDINPLKSRLIEQLAKLENAEAKRAANGLSRIIGELEAWQARNT